MQNVECPTTIKVERHRTAEGKMLNQYLVLKRIGEGPHAKIKLARDTKTNKLVAIKKFAMYLLKKKTKQVKQPNGTFKHIPITEDVLRQVQIARSVNHPNVVRMLEVMDDRDTGKLYLVMEYCEKGDVANWNHKSHVFDVRKELLQQVVVKRICLGMVKGLVYLHDQNIMHRDIKPSNILIDSNNNPKIIDFGRAAKLSQAGEKLKGSEGTYHFMAPEMLHEHDKSGYDATLCDIWSLGVTFYCIALQLLPFDGDPLLRLFEAIQKGIFEYPKDREVPAFMKRIIDRCLVSNPSKRAKLAELESILLE